MALLFGVLNAQYEQRRSGPLSAGEIGKPLCGIFALN